MGIIQRIIKIAKYLSDLPQTIYFNFRILPFHQAIQLPIYVSKYCRIKGAKKNSIRIQGEIRRGMVQFGKETGTKIGNRSKKLYIIFGKGSIMYFGGDASFSQGCSVLLQKKATVSFGNDFSCNTGSTIIGYKKINFGNDVVLGWNVMVRDGDGHYLTDFSDNIINHAKMVNIGDHVWLCNDCVIMKGVQILDDIVVACNSVVTKNLEVKNSVYGGNPSRILKRNVCWIRDGREYV